MAKDKNFLLFIKITVLLSVFLFAVSCENFSANNSGINPHHITGSRENREKLVELFNLLKMEQPGSEGEFTVIREIAGNLARHNEYDRLIHFLGGRTLNNPGDPYNSFYFMMIAFAHIQQGSEPIAALYLDLIVNNYPDLIINDESIHLISLRHIIHLNDNPERQVWYWEELISRFPEQIDLGQAYFMLGQARERVGDWNGAIAAYTNFLPHSEGTIIAGFPNAAQYARQQVDFSRSARDWTFENLNALRTAVQSAISTNNPRRLQGYKASVNFFYRSWQGNEIVNTRMPSLFLPHFWNNQVRFAPELDPLSNPTEAFLRTTGWSQGLPTWYFYFRRIHFPQDPSVHGRWEWAGIYYGERF
ncbi:MAG: tetratricopeptide repeat protein [Treponema sp.]|nr:tetratricopeptide repeat protein [Treponema sp.]